MAPLSSISIAGLAAIAISQISWACPPGLSKEAKNVEDPVAIRKPAEPAQPTGTQASVPLIAPPPLDPASLPSTLHSSVPASAPLSVPSVPPTSTNAATWIVVLLVGLGTGAAWILKKRSALPAEREAMRVVSSRSLGGRSRVVLLSVNGRELLLSVTDRGANLLAECSPETLLGHDLEIEEKELPGPTEAIQGLVANQGLEANRRIEATEPSLIAPPVAAPRPAKTQQSEAVLGLIQLKLRTSARALESDDEDLGGASVWAKDLLKEMRRGTAS